MKAERALELVQKYADLNRRIKEQKKSIVYNLEQCKGLDGKRGIVAIDDGNYWKDYDETHLKTWFSCVVDEDGDPVYLSKPNEKECPYCFIAYTYIVERKNTRKQLGVIKGTMSRWG